ncbi:MAG: hypothetical protein AAFQ82_13565, partial [Myxococcota bacterium]
KAYAPADLAAFPYPMSAVVQSKPVAILLPADPASPLLTSLAGAASALGRAPLHPALDLSVKLGVERPPEDSHLIAIDDVESPWDGASVLGMKVALPEHKNDLSAFVQLSQNEPRRALLQHLVLDADPSRILSAPGRRGWSMVLEADHRIAPPPRERSWSALGRALVAWLLDAWQNLSLTPFEIFLAMLNVVLFVRWRNTRKDYIRLVQEVSPHLK